MKRKFLLIVTALIAMIGTLCLAVACGEDPIHEDPPVAGEEAGEFYCDDGSETYRLTLTQECRYTLVLGDETLTGSYVPAGESVTLSYEGGQILATYYADVVTFTYHDVSYRFLRMVEYTVTFETGEGGSEVPSITVLNGRKAEKPEKPEKTGEVFVGWYTDSGFKSVYGFNEPVTSDLKLFARFVEPIEPEFTVTFDLNGAEGEAPSAVQTVGHKVFGLPEPEWEGHVFVGWWASHYGQAEKLTYRYEEETLQEDTTLFAVWEGDAPALSVGETQITWTQKGTNSQYTLVIENVTTGEEVERTTLGRVSYEFNFAGQAAGEYRITVTVGGATATAYYINKALAPVTVFTVEEDTLFFNGVKNAEGYLLQIECGAADHDHTLPKELSAEETYYDFGDCDMKDGAITFTVTAQATGYLSSTSEPYKVTRALPVPQGLTVERATETVKWDAVAHATSYDVLITRDGSEIISENVGDTREIPLKLYGAGSFVIRVTPKARGWNPSEPAEFTYEKLSLAAPTGIKLDNLNSKIVWDDVAGAKGYEVQIAGGDPVTVPSNEIEFTEEYYKPGTTDYPVSVRALGEKEENNSLWSDPLTVHYGVLTGELRYADGKVSWDPVFGVRTYYMQINDGDEVLYEDVDETSLPTNFKKSGDYTVKVRALYSTGEKSEPIEVSVRIFELAFDSQGGDRLPSLFLAVGDKIDFPRPEYLGHEFSGWYTAPGKGQGARYEDGRFVEENDRTLYAHWDSQAFKVSFVLGQYGIVTDELREGVTVYFQESAQLPVPESNDAIMGFKGWYDSAMGDVAYTGSDGFIQSFNQYGDITLFAQWSAILEFTETSSPTDGSRGYAVSKSRDLSQTQVTIPREYKGLPVVTVENFTDCTTLEVIRIPDSIRLISIATSESAFTGCTHLKRIEIYETDYNGTKFYEDVDGVLLYHNPNTHKTELKFYPVGRTDETYEIPDGVQTLPSMVFNEGAGSDPNFTGAKAIKTLIIPASVTLIEPHAVHFDYLGYIESVIFKAAENGETEQPLTISAGAFEELDHLKQLTLPARMTEFNFVEMFTNSSWAGCELTDVNVVGTGGKYSSISGVLVRDTDIGKELVFYPLGRDVFTAPDGIVSIGESALKGNGSITAIEIPRSIVNIGREAFMGCDEVETITFLGDKTDRALTIGEYAFAECDSSSLTSIVFPENLVKVCSYAFHATRITEVTVNSGALGEPLVFEDFVFGVEEGYTASPRVTTLNIGPYVKDIDFAAVFGPNLSTIKVDEANPYYDDNDDGVLYTEGRTKIVWIAPSKSGAFEIPGTVTEITADNFNGRTRITSVTIPASVTTIGKNAFRESGLTSVSFTGEGGGDLTIGDGAFSATEITEITFPERLVKLGAKMFEDCTELVTVNLPASLREISTAVDEDYDIEFFGMFATSSSSKKMKIKTINVPLESQYYGTKDGVFYKKTYDAATSSYVMSELLYCTVGDAREVTIPNTVEKIWSRAFYGGTSTYSTSNNSKVTAVKFTSDTLAEKTDASGAKQPRKLTIEREAFYCFISMQTLQLPTGTSTIGNRAFYKCTGIAELTVPNTVESIGWEAFSGCSKLKNLTFATGNEETSLRLEDAGGDPNASQEDGIFIGTLITEIVLPERTSYIGSCAFYNGYSSGGLKSITIPASVVEIASNAFYQVSSLTELTFTLENSRLERIGYHAFGNTKIETVTFPKSLVEMGNWAFGACTSLREVIFEDGSRLESLGNDSYGAVFSGCTALTTVNFGQNSSLRYIALRAFMGCTSLQEISIPASVETIGEQAFWQASSSTSTPSAPTALHTVTFEVNSEGVSALRLINRAFQYTGITELTLPETEFSIAMVNNPFAYCPELKTVHLSSTVLELSNALLGCKAIETITVAANNPNYKSENHILSNKNSGDIILVFGEITGEVRIPDGSLQIAASAFTETGVETLYIPRSVTRIGEMAFKDCKSLTSVTFEDGSALAAIGAEAFSGCTSLATFEFEKLGQLRNFLKTNDYTNPVANTFKGCTLLTKVDLSYTRLSDLPATVFSGCTGIDELKFPSVLTSLNMVFDGVKITEADLSKTKIGKINDNTFKNCTQLVSVSLPDTVESIGTSAFEGCTALAQIDLTRLTSLTSLPASTFKGCVSLTSVTLPSTLHGIGASCFEGCTLLATLNFDRLSYLETVGDLAFSGCGFTSITLLPSVTEWGGGASSDDDDDEDYPWWWEEEDDDRSSSDSGKGVFKGCLALREIIFSAGLTEETALQEKMFEGCTALSTLTFVQGCGLKELPKGMFTGCTGLEEVRLSGVETFGDELFKGCTGLLTVDLSETAATELGTDMFSGCNALSTIKLPKEITAIPSKAFQNFASLESIEIPANVTSIGSYAFDGCSSLKKIVLPAGLTDYTYSLSAGSASGFDSYVFRGCTQLTQIDLSLATLLTEIPSYTFQNCSQLVTISLPEGITKLGSSSFAGCTQLATINLGNITSFGDSALSGTAITSFTMKDGVSYGAHLFDGCGALTSFELGNYAKALGDGFLAGTGIQSIVITDTKLLGSSASYGAVGLFKDCKQLSSVTLPEGLKFISDQLFRGCTALTEIKIPSTVTVIGEYAFAESGLQTIDLSQNDGMTHLGGDSYSSYGYEYSFQKCEQLTTVKLPATVVSIGGYVFDGCTLLDDIDLSNIEKIAGYAFQNCAKLGSKADETGDKTLHFGKLTTLGSSVFKGCTGMESIELTNITEIAYSMFEGFTSLTKVSAPQATTVGSSAFKGATSLQTVELPLVATVGTNAFEGTTALTSVSLPKLTTLASNVFKDSGIQSLDLPKLEKIEAGSSGSSPFAGDCALKEFTVPEGVTSIANYAFSQTKLEKIVFAGGNFEAVGRYSYMGSSPTTYLFWKSEALREVILPKGLEELGTSCFYGCTLDTLEIPSSLAISSSTFSGATIQTLVLKEDDFTELKSGFAKELTEVKKIVVPVSVTTIAADAFTALTAETEICFVGSQSDVEARVGTDWKNGLQATVSYDYEGGKE